MKVEIHIKNKIHNLDNFTYIKGSFYLNNKYYCTEEAEKYFEKQNINDAKNIIKDLNGNFSIVLKRQDYIFVAVDHLRSIPIFYSITGKRVLISSNAYWLKRELKNFHYDQQGSSEFWYFLYCLNDRTLIKEIKQLLAGTYLIGRLNEDDFKYKIVQYYIFKFDNNSITNKYDYYIQLDSVLKKSFEQIANNIQDERIVIPLSGGLDSRLIVSLIKKCRLKNVLCYSYGNPDGFEAKISKKVAKNFGFQWIFIPYNSTKLFSEEMINEVADFIKYSSNLYTLPPILEDWLAVRKLKEMNLLAPNTIFIPGHGGDFVAGSWINIYGKLQNDIANIILKCNSPRFNWEKPKNINNILESINLQLKRFDTSSFNTDSRIHAWTWIERQSKRLINFVRVYEYFGFQWKIPFWDKSYMDFWSNVPISLKIGKKFYKSYLKDRNLFEFLEIETSATDKIFDNNYTRKIFQTSFLRYYKSSNYAEKILCNNFSEYLTISGKRIFQIMEPVTAPWILLEKIGIESIIDPEILLRYQNEN